MPLTAPTGVAEAPGWLASGGSRRLSGEEGKFRNPADTPSVWTLQNPTVRKKQAITLEDELK